MIKKTVNYLLSHGQILMMIGFIMAVLSLLVYMQTRFQGNAIPQIAFSCTIVGFVLYFIGRIFMINRKNRLKKTTFDDSATKDDV